MELSPATSPKREAFAAGSTEYARGAALGAPDAVQVCGRWHLLANMRQAVERWLHGAPARFRCLPAFPAGAAEAPPRFRRNPFGFRRARRDRAFPRSAPERAADAASRAQWQGRHDEVRRRHLAGEPLLAIARATGLARATVRKCARAESFPARAACGPGPSILDPCLPCLERRLAEGGENGLALWRELHGQGFPGGTKQVHRWLAERRTLPVTSGRRARKPHNRQHPAARDKGPPLPTPRQLAWLLVRPTVGLSRAEAAVVARVERDGEAKRAAELARRLAAPVRACSVGSRQKGRDPADPAAEFDAWLAEAHACAIPAFTTLAAGLEQDGAAVRAALTQPWSSGHAEEQVNRLKSLKRQSYGHAGFDLLRRHVLTAA